MAFATTDELQALRERIHSLEHRLLSFERTSIWLLTDLSDRLGTQSTIRDEQIVQVLREQHPDLADHPTLWADLHRLLSRRS